MSAAFQLPLPGIQAPVSVGRHSMIRDYFTALEQHPDDIALALFDVIEQLAFNEQGLIPAITQDANSKNLLMFAWMNKEALLTAIETQRMTYWSRSRRKLRIKGETSGHVQSLVSMSFDCDGDAILCMVDQQGAACHTGKVDYEQAPAGLPLVQHALLILLEHVKHRRLSLTRVAEKTAHNPALHYAVTGRGFIREGYFADLVLVDNQSSTIVSHENSFYHCGWSPFSGQVFSSQIIGTWVNGRRVYTSDGLVPGETSAMALAFAR